MRFNGGTCRAVHGGCAVGIRGALCLRADSHWSQAQGRRNDPDAQPALHHARHTKLSCLELNPRSSSAASSFSIENTCKNISDLDQIAPANPLSASACRYAPMVDPYGPGPLGLAFAAVRWSPREGRGARGSLGISRVEERERLTQHKTSHHHHD